MNAAVLIVRALSGGRDATALGGAGVTGAVVFALEMNEKQSRPLDRCVYC
jgi:hypothetical protein